jgi:four helix bundle protein
MLSDFKEQMKRRTQSFAHECVKYAVTFPDNDLGRHVRQQLTRSATSVAANYRAACIAQTVPTTVAKMRIVFEEADESQFRIEFMEEEAETDRVKAQYLCGESHEITSILLKAVMTLSNSSGAKFKQ